MRLYKGWQRGIMYNIVRPRVHDWLPPRSPSRNMRNIFVPQTNLRASGLARRLSVMARINGPSFSAHAALGLAFCYARVDPINRYARTAFQFAHFFLHCWRSACLGSIFTPSHGYGQWGSKSYLWVKPVQLCADRVAEPVSECDV